MWKQANILLKYMAILKYCIPKSPTLLKSYKFKCVCVCVLFFFSVPLRSIAFTLTTTELGIASLIPHGVSFQIDFGFCVPKMNQCPFRFGKSPYWRQLWKTLNCSRCSHLLLLFFFWLDLGFLAFSAFLLSSLLWLFAVAIAVAHSWVNISKISHNCVSQPPFCGFSWVWVCACFGYFLHFFLLFFTYISFLRLMLSAPRFFRWFGS